MSERLLVKITDNFYMENKNQNINCPLCNSTKISLFTKKKGFFLYKCINCKLLFLFPLPKNISIYDKSYFSGAENGFGYVDYDADKEPMTPTFQKYLDIVYSLGLKNGKLLDIGAATGFFMNLAEKRGFDVTGVEISDFAAESGRRKNLNIITGDIFSPPFPEQHFDVITMFDVIEHVPDPKATLLEARRILKNRGFLVINTPDAQSLWARFLGSHWQLILLPEHIHYFSPKNISEYLQKNGFETTINTKIGKRFTLQYIFKMLYKWSGSRIFLTNIFSKGFLSKIYLPINLYDNFFMILRKID